VYGKKRKIVEKISVAGSAFCFDPDPNLDTHPVPGSDPNPDQDPASIFKRNLNMFSTIVKTALEKHNTNAQSLEKSRLKPI